MWKRQPACVTAPTVFEASFLRPEYKDRRYTTVAVVSLSDDPVLRRAFGESEYDELTRFFEAFADVLRTCGTHTARLEARLADDAHSSFVLVAAPTEAATIAPAIRL